MQDFSHQQYFKPPGFPGHSSQTLILPKRVPSSTQKCHDGEEFLGPFEGRILKGDELSWKTTLMTNSWIMTFKIQNPTKTAQAITMFIIYLSQTPHLKSPERSWNTKTRVFFFFKVNLFCIWVKLFLSEISTTSQQKQIWLWGQIFSNVINTLPQKIAVLTYRGLLRDNDGFFYSLILTLISWGWGGGALLHWAP